jgi:hypothetical protein
MVYSEPRTSIGLVPQNGINPMNKSTLNYPEVIQHTGVTLSDQIIPAIPGEYYSYPSEFSDKKPVYVFMKCKSNKNRPEEDLDELGNEANLLFMFTPEGVSVCAVKIASELGIVDEHVQNGLSHDTFIAETQLSEVDFEEVRSTRDGRLLKDIYTQNSGNQKQFIELKPDMVISFMTTGGKYGMFMVKSFGTNSVKVEACHILL